MRRWTDTLLSLLTEGDPLGTRDLVTHEEPLDEAPRWYRSLRDKEDGPVKVVLRPWG